MCIMMARLRPMTFSPTGMPACLRASSRQSNAARSCAKHDPERNVLGCSQTLKNDTLTHPSLWADHSIFSLIALLCLFFGQRLAKDYGGAVVIASYYAVAILGLILLGVKSTP